MTKLIIASNNEHKVEEIAKILNINNFDILDLTMFPNIVPAIEDGLTLEENAYKKAYHVYKQTNILSLADDSGLAVDYLLGEPGVYSARYSGERADYEDNNKKLLKELKCVPPRKRTARFRCCIAIVGDAINKVVDGCVEGKILFKPRGANGFGYDPLFLPDGFSKTLAEMDNVQKNKISHRSRALEKAKQILVNI